MHQLCRQGESLSVEEVASLIEASPGYRESKEVVLLSCNTGKGFAKSLAKRLGKPTSGPSELLYPTYNAPEPYYIMPALGFPLADPKDLIPNWESLEECYGFCPLTDNEMTNKYSLLIALAILVMAIGVAFWPRDSKVILIPPAGEFALSDGELRQLPALALDGDRVAAVRLAKYYSFRVINDEAAMKWLEIAAKNGDVDSQYAIGFLSIDRNDTVKGLHWLELAAQNGSEAAKQRLLLEASKRSAASKS